MNDETMDALLHNLQVECLLASANCARVNFAGYKTSWLLAVDLNVKKNAAEVLRAMWGKVEAIVNGVALEFENVLNAPNRETIGELRNWLASEVETTKKAKEFLDRVESVATSRKKIDAVLSRLHSFETFLKNKKDEQLVRSDWDLKGIEEHLERIREASLALETLTKGDAE